MLIAVSGRGWGEWRDRAKKITKKEREKRLMDKENSVVIARVGGWGRWGRV